MHEKSRVSNEIFLLGEKQLGVVSKYQYLGLLLTEFLHYNEMAKAVARLAGGALSLLIVFFLLTAFLNAHLNTL
jgi:hypothetical protein